MHKLQVPALARSLGSQFEKYYNAKMIVCMAKGVSYERLAEALHRYGFWEAVSSFQKVGFNRRYGIVTESQDAKDLLVESCFKH